MFVFYTYKVEMGRHGIVAEYDVSYSQFVNTMLSLAGKVLYHMRTYVWYN